MVKNLQNENQAKRVLICANQQEKAHCDKNWVDDKLAKRRSHDVLHFLMSTKLCGSSNCKHNYTIAAYFENKET